MGNGKDINEEYVHIKLDMIKDGIENVPWYSILERRKRENVTIGTLVDELSKDLDIPREEAKQYVRTWRAEKVAKALGVPKENITYI